MAMTMTVIPATLPAGTLTAAAATTETTIAQMGYKSMNGRSYYSLSFNLTGYDQAKIVATTNARNFVLAVDSTSNVLTSSSKVSSSLTYTFTSAQITKYSGKHTLYVKGKGTLSSLKIIGYKNVVESSSAAKSSSVASSSSQAVSSSMVQELNFMDQLYSKFVARGYGVVIGEFGATNKYNDSARTEWAKAYTEKAASLGFSCVLWDNDLTGYGAENFGMINRNSLYVYYPSILNAMLNSFN